MNDSRKAKDAILPGLEPGIFCSVGRRVIHCATRPLSETTFEAIMNRKIFIELQNCNFEF